LTAPHATSGRGLSRQLGLSIGCLPLRVHTKDEDLLTAATLRYEPFLASTDASLKIDVDCGGSLSPVCPEFAYEYGDARLQVASGGVEFRGVRNEYILDSLLRIFLSWELLSRTGFLLHAATVVREGKAYVFTGRSGAGKSTLASLAPVGSVLTDEISLLRKEGGEWRAYGTPFWGEFRAAGSNTSAPVAGIFRLLQSPKNLLLPLRPMETLRAALPNVLFFSSEPNANRRLLDILTRAVQEIPGYNLEFRKDKTFWEVLPA